MSHRPSDWTPIGLDMDPVPGDPVVVIRGGRNYQRVAVAIGEFGASVQRLDLDGVESQAVDALMEKKEEVVEEIRRAQGRYEVTGGALVDDGQTLEEVQEETARALAEANRALAERVAAERQALQSQDRIRDAKQDDEKDELRRQVEQAEGAIEVAAGTIAAARARVDDAVATRNASAERAISLIQEITSSDGLNDSWWDDWGADAVALVAKVADIVATVAGVLALVTAFIPGLQALSAALFLVSTIAGAVSALANLALAATGEKSWAEVGIAIATTALTVVGLGVLGQGAKLLTKTVLKPSTFDRIQHAVCPRVPFGQCFVAGTLVHTPDGPRPIEEIRAGDKVWSHNLETGLDEVQRVNETFVRTADTLYHLTIGNDVVTTTAEHPFMVEGLGWIQAEYLRPGQLLVTDIGAARLIAVEIEHRADDDEQAVYNIHVETRHNYYIVLDTVAVLVHNTVHGGGSAKAWESSDAHVAELANKIDAAHPGRVREINAMVPMRNGLKREVDIVTDTVYIQVKEGKARGLIGQIQKTIDTTGNDTIGYAPDMLHGSLKAAERQGVRVYSDADDLINNLEEKL